MPGKRIVGLNMSFTPEAYQDRAFDPARNDYVTVAMCKMRDYFARHGIAMHTLDMVDFQDPDVQYVVYFDYSWRSLRVDPFLSKIPYAKRVLVMQEPSNTNPSLYYIPLLRRRFKTVFSWNDALVKKYGYVQSNGFPWADPDDYIQNPFESSRHSPKKLLVAINSNRWAYMPSSMFNYRIKVFKYFEEHCPGEFDLYGQGWNKPRISYEKWTGFHKFSCYRGTVPLRIEDKLEVLSQYRFTICIENNVNESGYVNDKFIDCLCARCVPVYYAWKGAAKYVPTDCFVNFRDFNNLDSLNRYLHAMDQKTYDGYVEAINRFLAGPKARYFTYANKFQTLIRTLYPDISLMD